MAVLRCFQSLVELCRGKFVVLKVDAMNLLGIVNRGSRRLSLNQLARDLFWFCSSNKIVVSVEWAPREENSFADDLSKLSIPDDVKLNPVWFRWLVGLWGPQTCDVFASINDNPCEKFCSLHWCKGTSGVNAFRCDLSIDNI